MKRGCFSKFAIARCLYVCSSLKMASCNNHRTEIKQEELCRTCLSKDNPLLSIFDELTGTTTTLDYIVTTTTGLKILIVGEYTAELDKKSDAVTAGILIWTKSPTLDHIL